jgi:hypothetical protein
MCRSSILCILRRTSAIVRGCQVDRAAVATDFSADYPWKCATACRKASRADELPITLLSAKRRRTGLLLAARGPSGLEISCAHPWASGTHGACGPLIAAARRPAYGGRKGGCNRFIGTAGWPSAECRSARQGGRARSEIRSLSSPRVSALSAIVAGRLAAGEKDLSAGVSTCEPLPAYTGMMKGDT